MEPQEKKIIYQQLGDTILPVNPVSLRNGKISYDGELHLFNYGNKVVLYSMEDNGKIILYGFLQPFNNKDNLLQEEDLLLDGKISLFGFGLSLEDIMKKSLEDMMKKGLLGDKSIGRINVHTNAGIRICEYDIGDYGHISFSCKDIKGV